MPECKGIQEIFLTLQFYHVRTVNHLQTFDIVIIKIKDLTHYDNCPTVSSKLIFIFVVPVDVP